MGQKKTDTYDVIYSSIRRITKLRTAEGEIRFTATMKLIYAYIWTFQENKDRGNNDPIHTNTNVIAWEMGVSEKSVIDALKALDAAKVVIKRTVKVRGNVNSSNYVAIPPASVAALGITPPHPNESKSKPKKNKAAVGPTGDALHYGSATGTDEPTNEEKKGNGEQAQQQESEQQSPGMSPTAIYSESKPVQRANDVASSSATDDPEQRSGVSLSAGDSCDDVPANYAVSVPNEGLRDEPQRACIGDLNYWLNQREKGFGFYKYGQEWGKSDVGEIMALIWEHYVYALELALKNENVYSWISAPFKGVQLRPEARAWAESEVVLTWQEEIQIVWNLREVLSGQELTRSQPGEHMRPDDVPAPTTEPVPAMQQVNGPDVDHINCEDSEEKQEEEFEAPF